MVTRSRYIALKWFADHEAKGPDEVFRRRPPSARMRGLMLKEGDIQRDDVGQFKYGRWLLTPQGRDKLQAEPLPKTKRRSKADANEHEPAAGGG
jgi:hypothetical protein